MTTPEIPATLCEDCVKLGMMSQPTEPHNALFSRGTMPPSSSNAVKELFRCANCDTLWVRLIDKWGMAGPFYLLSSKCL